MKPFRNTFGLLVVVLGSALLGGCYTQLALNDDEPDSTAASQLVAVPEPAPTIIVMPPLYEQPWVSPPSVTVAPPPAPESQTRDIGNQRSSPAQTGSTGTDTRTMGATRGGR